MTSKSSGCFSLVLAFLLGVVAACFLAPKLAPRVAQLVPWPWRTHYIVPPAVQTLTVGPTADVVQAQDLILHLSSKDTVMWKASDPNVKNLYIDFVGDLFEGTAPTSDNPPRHRVSCDGPACTSGNIKSNAGVTPYKYWQTLIYKDGHKDYQDARIIIQW